MNKIKHNSVLLKPVREDSDVFKNGLLLFKVKTTKVNQGNGFIVL